MKTKLSIWISLSAVILMVSSFSIGRMLYAQNDSPPRVEIPGTQLLHLNSNIVGQEYDLYVHLPRFYEDTTKTFPVIYLLDAQWDFPLVTAIFGEQYYDGFLPGIVIVGITWGGNKPNHDGLRARDLTPTKIQQMPNTGNAPKFLAFIKEELIPFIESKYRVKKDRTLMGSSFGGLFSLYAMFEETDTFQRYVLTSPAVGWDNEVIYDYEESLFKKKTGLPVRLFMAVGELEQVGSFKKFADQLKKRSYEGLRMETRVLENIGHSGTKAEGYTRGLQFVFARPSLTVAPEVLDQYIGTYELNPAFTAKIQKESDHLVLKTPDNATVVLHAESETDFYLKGTYLFVRFKKDDASQLVGMEVEQFNGTNFLKRVK
jgi:hypothetical protein